ncbi:MAG: Ribonuclease P protein component 1 [Candidatus Methanofastidiosum methylothiophilum]|uniref:Ribonuclease P protein component 1 n=1 Tax=Candidatus Methanofastidiosum methylothiophilum TaxID=1705564 RepID=A0A150IQ47_9EURY|nr:MAG: Ribonuclease P protein component 1 [Candidatus Methanofastidiosum methylthiophilus]KYC47087.1 MAG: Ribonuclease P protein component 1 [Candidatus Methanofastidiosum methylthiophilus]KYC49515.1 MAG: Ribonuclease P protein component 1 [Candidatus Methanofastidiosum methylthiophilus]
MNHTILLGKNVEVIQCSNRYEVGIKGLVIEDTKNTIKIRTENGVKVLIKNNIILMVNDRKIDGNLLIGKEEERIKRM